MNPTNVLSAPNKNSNPPFDRDHTGLQQACQPSAQAVPDQDILPGSGRHPAPSYFIERIDIDKVFIQVMVSPGEEAHTYEPMPEQMKDLSIADLFFTIGIEYEATWIHASKDINPNLSFIASPRASTKFP